MLGEGTGSGSNPGTGSGLKIGVSANQFRFRLLQLVREPIILFQIRVFAKPGTRFKKSRFVQLYSG